MMIVPAAANMPPTPWLTLILAFGTWAAAVPRICFTLSCRAYIPYMPECMKLRPPPLVFKGSLPPGEAAQFIWDGNTRPGGKLPLNTNGGGLSFMHSGMYGMYALQESVKQMRGTAAAQVPNAKISVSHGVGGMFAAAGTIIMSNERP